MARHESPPPPVGLELEPREFVIALIMAATWYFAGPLGIIPTLWFGYVIMREPPTWLAASMRLLPVAARRQLAARAATTQAAWRMLAAPWQEPAARLPGETGAEHGAAAADDGRRWMEADPLGLPAGVAPALPLPLITVGELARSPNLLIVGNRGSGKTTLLQALLAERHERCYVLDPHAHPEKWPANATVIGGGRRFAAIYAALLRAKSELDARAKRLNEDQHARFIPLTLASDEWGAVVGEISPGKDEEPPGRVTLSLLKEGRKFKLNFIGCAHGDTAESLGCKGDTAAFRASFDWFIYCGAFVGPQLRDMAALVRQLPLGQTPEGNRFPLMVVACSPTTGERRLLDLRACAATPAAHTPAPRAARPVLHAPTAAPTPTPPTRLVDPLSPQPPGDDHAWEPPPARQTDNQTDGVGSPVATLPALPAPQTDNQTDGQPGDPLSAPAPAPAATPARPPANQGAAPPALRSREDIVRALVIQGWTISQIREVVKGDNRVLGELVRGIEYSLTD